MRRRMASSLEADQAGVTANDPAPAPPHRRATWGAVAVIALAAAGAGLYAGTRVGGTSPPASPAAPGAMPSMPGMEQGRPPPSGAGSQAVYVSPARQQLIGVRTARVARREVARTIRTVGTLAYDETRTTQIHTRVAGWVERLDVDYIGKLVRRGEPLFAVYSPDLVTAEADYLVALNARRRLPATASAAVAASADAVLAAARERMARWNVTDAQIAELARVGHPARTMTIASPFDGVVVAKQAYAGQYVTPDMTSFQLADLSTIWAVGQVFEYEAARLHVGDAVEVEFPYGQAKPRRAGIDFVYPAVDPTTRRARFRAVLDNRDGALKPDTYVTLVWHGPARDQLVVPEEAVIDTGVRQYVLLALADGYFEPRTVTLGPPIDGAYPVVSGIGEGDRVVTSAQFLIDAETNLRSAMQNMAGMPGMNAGKPALKPPAGSAAGSATPPMRGM